LVNFADAMRIVRKIRDSKLAPLVRARRDEYGSDWLGDPSDRPAAWQLRRFNEIWKGYAQRIRAYRDLLDSRRVPARFESWEQFAATVPVLNKSDVNDRVADLTDPSRPADSTRTTGGSTGEPTRMPASRSEYADTQIDKWIARAEYGVKPSDRAFLIWGHSHTLGAGLRGRAKAFLRQAKDSLVGTYRFSAYNLSEQATRHAGDLILSLRPDFIISYSGALEFLARVNEDRAEQFARLGLKTAIATGEVFPTPDGPAVAQRILGCPVSMEYGSVETDVIAHTSLSHEMDVGTVPPAYRVFWRRYFLECEDAGPDGERALLVTSLFPRAFPLIRYRIGDFVRLFDGDEPRALTRMTAVVGRSNSFVELSDGTRVHTMGLKHCVEGIESVSRFQVVQPAGANNTRANGGGRGIKELRVVLAGAGAPDRHDAQADAARRAVEAAIREKAGKIHPELGRMPIVFDRTLIQSRAGKTPMIAEAAPDS
jgi:phenylacetate-CoA ligase